MGLNIVLTDCSGELIESIDDPKNFVHKLWPPADEASGSMLATFINEEQKIFYMEYREPRDYRELILKLLCRTNLQRCKT